MSGRQGDFAKSHRMYEFHHFLKSMSRFALANEVRSTPLARCCFHPDSSVFITFLIRMYGVISEQDICVPLRNNCVYKKYSLKLSVRPVKRNVRNMTFKLGVCSCWQRPDNISDL